MTFEIQSHLENTTVRLRPLKEEDFEDLYKVASDPKIWAQHQNKNRHTREDFIRFFKEAIDSKGAFVIIDKMTEKIIGSSRFKTINLAEGVIEIGWSFLERKYWGGKYNREFKRLMVNYALQFFEHVVFYVDSKNFRSQRALAKLGAYKSEDFDESWVLPKKQGLTFVIDSLIK